MKLIGVLPAHQQLHYDNKKHSESLSPVLILVPVTVNFVTDALHYTIN